jgi:hypothetical protein
MLTFAGLGAGVVPLAVVIHLIAELAATAGRPDAGFFVRHAYLALPLAAAVAAFAATVGLGGTHREFVRRCALARADLERVGTGPGIGALFLAGIAFFGATQVVEGIPIAAGSVVVGLAIAAAGSLLAAAVVFGLGRTFCGAVSAAAGVRRPTLRRPLPTPAVAGCPTRCAASAFSLFIPNRPPPGRSLSSSSFTLRKGHRARISQARRAADARDGKRPAPHRGAGRARARPGDHHPLRNRRRRRCAAAAGGGQRGRR